MSDKRMKALIVSYHFPPSASTGAIRSTKFVKYLRDYGWQPVVLACRDSFDFGAGKNQELLNDIPKDVRVYRTWTFEPLSIIDRGKRRDDGRSPTSTANKPLGSKASRGIKAVLLDILNVPDRYQGWIIFALIRGLIIALKERIDVIFATTPAPSALVVGYILSVVTRKPLIVDYRDPWTSAPWARKNITWFNMIIRKTERAILRHASYIISVSDMRAEELRKAYPDIDGSKHVVITNGYDVDEAIKGKVDLYEKLTFIHAGHLYGDDGVDDFLDAMESVASKDKTIKDGVRILFAGTKPNTLSLKKLEEKNMVTCMGRVPRRECLAAIAKAHTFLVFLQNDKTFNAGCMASKIFDAMLLKIPVLAVVGNGTTKNVIEQGRLGTVVDYGDKVRLERVIADIYSQYKNKKLTANFNEDMILKYDRRELTRQLAAIFNKAIENAKE